MLLGRSVAMKPGVMKIPTPMTLETTMAAASQGTETPLERRGSRAAEHGSSLVHELVRDGQLRHRTHCVEPYFAVSPHARVDEMRGSS